MLLLLHYPLSNAQHPTLSLHMCPKLAALSIPTHSRPPLVLHRFTTPDWTGHPQTSSSPPPAPSLPYTTTAQSEQLAAPPAHVEILQRNCGASPVRELDKAIAGAQASAFVLQTPGHIMR